VAGRPSDLRFASLDRVCSARRPIWRRHTQEVVSMLKPGDVAPDFNVEDSDGNEVSLQKLRGKTVVLWFYPKADTPG